jgi:hypothetical protein
LGRAKDIRVRPISASDAHRIVKTLHYSGKAVNNSQLHLGVFLDEKCGGVMQFGPSLDKRKIQGLVHGTLWNEFIELNRMAFSDFLPRNSESRAIGYAFRWMRKQYPHIKWCVSFADGTQCGDGTIYRASGFVLTGIKKNDQIWAAPTGELFSRTSMTDRSSKNQQRQARLIASRTTLTKGRHILENGASSMKPFIDANWKPLEGFQLRYIYFLDPTARERLAVPSLPFSEINRLGASMYKGVSRVRSADSGTSGNQSERGSAILTRTLNINQLEKLEVENPDGQ